MKQSYDIYKKIMVVFLTLLLFVNVFCSVLVYSYNVTLTITLLLVTPIICAVIYICMYKYFTKSDNEFSRIYSELIVQDMPKKFPLPAMKIDEKGHILYANTPAKNLFGDLNNVKIRDIGIDINPSSLPISGDTVLEKKIEEKYYQINAVSFIEHNGNKKNRSIYIFFNDTSELNTYKTKCLQSAPTLILMDVDGDSTLQSLTHQDRTNILPALEKIIYSFAGEVNGVLRSTSSGRYIIFTEAMYVDIQKKKKFPILEAVRSASSNISITLSIGICSDESAKEAENGAMQALEMATARGGDQVVIKANENFTYFGANREGISIRSKVKSRIFAGKLLSEISNCKDVFIMGHTAEDADSLGAAYALYAIAHHVNKNAYIVLSDKPVATGIVELMKNENVPFMTRKEAITSISSSSAVIVVDTLRKDASAEPKLYELGKFVIAIDHHRKGKETFAYKDMFHEPGSSSVCEMLTEMVQYVPALKITKLQAEILLSGIMIDTKQFSVGTGSRTYEAAAYLLKQSASPLVIKELQQEDLKTFTIITDAVEKADYLKSGIAIATMPLTSNPQPVLAAKVADDLLKIKGVKASFTLTQSQKDVLISARSLGNINVQVIMEKLSGGGHMTVAASSLKDMTVLEAKKTFIRCN